MCITTDERTRLLAQRRSGGTICGLLCNQEEHRYTVAWGFELHDATGLDGRSHSLFEWRDEDSFADLDAAISFWRTSVMGITPSRHLCPHCSGPYLETAVEMVRDADAFICPRCGHTQHHTQISAVQGA